MRISAWSSDVCSSDLGADLAQAVDLDHIGRDAALHRLPGHANGEPHAERQAAEGHEAPVPGLDARRADAFVPCLSRLLVGRHRLGRLAVALDGTFELHRGPVLLEAAVGRAAGTVSGPDPLRFRPAVVARGLPAEPDTRRTAARPRSVYFRPL